jgi:hypothetical protein
MNARQWLKENGYDDILQLIQQVVAEWARKGVTTRRNWWEVLAGDHKGGPRYVEGIEFPVLAAAQEHEGKAITENAIRRSPKEAPPPKDYRGQWSVPSKPKRKFKTTQTSRRKA